MSLTRLIGLDNLASEYSYLRATRPAIPHRSGSRTSGYRRHAAIVRSDVGSRSACAMGGL